MSFEISAFREGTVAPRMRAFVRPFSSVTSVVYFQGAGPHERSLAGTTDKGSFVVVSSDMILKVSLSRELLGAVREGALVGLLPSMNSLVSL